MNDSSGTKISCPRERNHLGPLLFGFDPYSSSVNTDPIPKGTDTKYELVCMDMFAHNVHIEAMSK